MGVTGLWTVLQPCARPIKLDTLNRKRLAVDASIWIYQFLKAVRDKDGNALRNSHVVGFFRRICKLLFFGIKPVFVFDGGAPALKRQTISGRKARREGRREDAVRTAGKLLAVQMQRRAEEEDRKRRLERDRPQAAPEEEEEVLPENLVYAEELGMTEQERNRNRAFKKRDAYHLPQLDVGLAEMGAPNDPRVMNQEELEEYARHFHSGEDINLYDFSKIDFNSSFFQSLPAADRYNILNAARLRSRLRMGYSKEQLDTMFPDRMAFSRFQIERVKERNELTQRLMNLNGMNGDEFINGTQRVAGERGKEYVLVKNDGVEGGWALGVVSNKNEGERNQPIDVEGVSRPSKIEEDDDWEAEEDFEDVPIEGMNRLPKQPMGRNHNELQAIQSDEARKARRALYEQRKGVVAATEAEQTAQEEDPDSLFIADEPQEEPLADDDLFEDVVPATESDNEELQRAIAMSLEKDEEQETAEEAAHRTAMMNAPKIDRPLEFDQKNARAGRAFAQFANSAAQASQHTSAFDNAFANSTARRLSPTPQERLASASKPKSASNNGFSGPLPFEALNLGGSFLRRKKKKPEDEGGFEKEGEKGDESQPLPPWFAGDVREGHTKQNAIEAEAERQRTEQERQKAGEDTFGEIALRTHETREVIDLDDAPPSQRNNQVIEVESSEDESDDVEMSDAQSVQGDLIEVGRELKMDDVADLVRTEPPTSDMPSNHRKPEEDTQQKRQPDSQIIAAPAAPTAQPEKSTAANAQPPVEDEELVDWSDSDVETREAAGLAAPPAQKIAASPSPAASSPDDDFEDVDVSGPAAAPSSPPIPTDAVSSLRQEDTFDRAPTEPLPDLDEDDEYSDPEDEELLRNLAAEAEEHARFAASLNSGATTQSAESYERELRQLRNQQKKDRRDADEVTSIMIGECQQLLRLFGLPYITAPMEAEAQCAELVRLGLVDGIVTDDSDTFLFGGTRVYKNMFNQAKFVECYLSSDLEREYSLTREKVIQIAHLLGSDYTEGLPGIGPVTALEVMSEFSSLEGFKEWWTQVQSSLAETRPSEIKQSSFRKKFRKHATKLFLPPTFPDPRVDEAYLHPDVDHDDTPFQWGVPDLEALRAFLMQTIGWSRERADEVLVPVVRDMNRREQEGTQSNITRFFGGAVGAGAARMRGLQGDHASKSSKAGERNSGAAAEEVAAAEESAALPGSVQTSEGFAPRRRVGGSKRMEDALGKLHAQASRRRRARSGERGLEEVGEDGGGEADEEDVVEEQRPRKAARKGKGRAKKATGTA